MRYVSAQAAVTKQPGGLSDRNSLCHSSEAWNSKIKVLAGLVSSEASLVACTRLLSPCVPSWSFLCTCVPVSHEGTSPVGFTLFSFLKTCFPNTVSCCDAGSRGFGIWISEGMRHRTRSCRNGPSPPEPYADAEEEPKRVLSLAIPVSPGKAEGHGKMHITLCDFIVPWDTLSTTQKKSLNHRYQMGCECKITRCPMIPCYISSPDECLWMDWVTEKNINGHQAKFFACIKRSDGSCAWYRGAAPPKQEFLDIEDP
uniref:TIMP metallopeptidase inhibitor 2 n=1 Tax=Sus scrofa TaxID=9823 RepID=A0A8D0K0I6_PIG